MSDLSDLRKAADMLRGSNQLSQASVTIMGIPRQRVAKAARRFARTFKVTISGNGVQGVRVTFTKKQPGDDCLL